MNRIRVVMGSSTTTCLSLLSLYRSEILCKVIRPLCTVDNQCASLNSVGAISQLNKLFTERGIPEPLSSALNIVSSVTKCSYKETYQLWVKSKSSPSTEKLIALSDEQLQQLSSDTDKRLQRMPVQYIIGEWDFRDLCLHMEAPVFIPRPETEDLVELLSSKVSSEPQQFLEIGCGTGAISLALLKENPQLTCIAIDKNLQACSLTQRNAHAYYLMDRIDVRNEDIMTDFQCDKQFDFIVSNPPYIPTLEVKHLDTEVKMYESHVALDGGWDGLDVVHKILEISETLLKTNGTLWLEVDYRHPSKVEKLLNQECYSKYLRYVKMYEDFRKLPRFCEIRKI